MMLREYPLGRETAILTLSSIECLGGFLSFVVLWVLGLKACQGSSLRAWVFTRMEPFVYTACVHRGTLHFFIKYITYPKKKKKNC
jgi:hypothetical protein